MTIIIPVIAQGVSLSEIRDIIRQNGYGTDINSAIDAAINSIYRRINGMQRWPWLQRTLVLQTIAGQNYVEPSDVEVTDIGKLIGLYLVSSTDDRYDMTALEYPALRRKQALDPAPNTPSEWAYANGLFQLYPTPDQVYTVNVDYQVVAPKLIDDNDVALIPMQYVDVLVWGAIKSLAFRERDWNAEGAANQEYTARLAEMIAEVGVESQQSHSEVGYSGFYDAYSYQGWQL